MPRLFIVQLFSLYLYLRGEAAFSVLNVENQASQSFGRGDGGGLTCEYPVR